MIRRLIHTVFAREPHPTALASIHAPDAMTVLTCLQADGFRVPGDIAVLSLQGDPSLAHLIPAIAHYEWRSDLLVKRLMRAILEATTGTATPESTLIMSRFYPGESLGPMPPPRP
jgi:DNA-binding LacI/PurR family transcriptional regulator